MHEGTTAAEIAPSSANDEHGKLREARRGHNAARVQLDDYDSLCDQSHDVQVGYRSARCIQSHDLPVGICGNLCDQWQNLKECSSDSRCCG